MENQYLSRVQLPSGFGVEYLKSGVLRVFASILRVLFEALKQFETLNDQSWLIYII